MKIRYTKDLEAGDLGDRIWRCRRVTKKPFYKILEESDISKSNWYKIEAGETESLPVETLRRMQKVLNNDLGIDTNYGLKLSK